MCHFLLQTPNFFLLLLHIDAELAAQTKAAACPFCGGVLHRSDYERKPRACPREVLGRFQSRFSFCCSLCRKRTTPESLRFLGRRVYLGLAVVLLPQRRKTLSSAAIELCETLGVPTRTLSRWRQWWIQRFPCTKLWQALCARFMPPVATIDLPTSLITRFSGAAHEAMLRLLAFLCPLSVAR